MAASSRTPAIWPTKMLQDRRTAGLGKPRCGDGSVRERQLRAELDPVGMLQVRDAAISDVVGSGSEQSFDENHPMTVSRGGQLRIMAKATDCLELRQCGQVWKSHYAIWKRRPPVITGIFATFGLWLAALSGLVFLWVIVVAFFFKPHEGTDDSRILFISMTGVAAGLGAMGSPWGTIGVPLLMWVAIFFVVFFRRRVVTVLGRYRDALAL